MHRRLSSFSVTIRGSYNCSNCNNAVTVCVKKRIADNTEPWVLKIKIKKVKENADYS